MVTVIEDKLYLWPTIDYNGSVWIWVDFLTSKPDLNPAWLTHSDLCSLTFRLSAFRRPLPQLTLMELGSSFLLCQVTEQLAAFCRLFSLKIFDYLTTWLVHFNGGWLNVSRSNKQLVFMLMSLSRAKGGQFWMTKFRVFVDQPYLSLETKLPLVNHHTFVHSSMMPPPSTV